MQSPKPGTQAAALDTIALPSISPAFLPQAPDPCWHTARQAPNASQPQSRIRYYCQHHKTTPLPCWIKGPTARAGLRGVPENHALLRGEKNSAFKRAVKDRWTEWT